MGEFEDKINGILSSPEDMGKIMNLARSIGGSGDAEPNENSPPDDHKGSDLSGLLGDLDPSLIKTLGSVMGGMSEGGNKSAMLGTITPYLKDERKEQLKRAMNLAKLARVAKLALSEDLLGGDKDNV